MPHLANGMLNCLAQLLCDGLCDGAVAFAASCRFCITDSLILRWLQGKVLLSQQRRRGTYRQQSSWPGFGRPGGGGAGRSSGR